MSPWILSSALLLLATGCQAPRLYWGDVHGHTAHSDGQGTVAQFLTHARDNARLDFVIVTDHDFGHAAPWRMAPEVWTHIQETVEVFHRDGAFVAIAGYEWTSQPKYWAQYEGGTPSEDLYAGPPRFFNHKNVYFPRPVPYLFSAKDEAYHTPDQLAAAVAAAGGLIHNNHPDAGPGGRDQWDYSPSSARIIVNTEMMPDVVYYEGKRYETKVESTVNAYLLQGGRTGFVSGSDTHEGKPSARTAVWARALTREAVFEALRQRRCYAVSHARIGLDFKINGQPMGQVVVSEGPPQIRIRVEGTDTIEEVALVRNGEVIHRVQPGRPRARVRFVDEGWDGEDYYYVRVTQADTDPHGNPSRAWSSPIWVQARDGER